MIQCLKCNRVWPTGTVWCGICKATLGVKLCPDGHVNLPISTCCTACGKAPLSQYCPSRSLKGLLRTSVLFPLTMCLPFVWTGTCRLGEHAVALLQSLVLKALLLSVLVGIIGGPSARTAIINAWKSLLRLTLKGLQLIILCFKK